MIRRKSIIGFLLLCALLLCAVAAQGASAAGNGQTIFECSGSAPTKEFSDAHCDNTGGTSFGHVQFPATSTAITLTNGGTKNETKEATTWSFGIASLHGFTNVAVECTNVEGTGTALNSAGPPMKDSGSGTIKCNDGTGLLGRTNQAGCAAGTATQGAKIATINVEAETVDGLSPSGTGMGLKFKPAAGGTNLTTITFEGTCGLHAFGAIPVAGSFIATAGGSPTGRGATAWFIPGDMDSLTVGGSVAELEGKATLKRASTSNALTLTTS